MATSQIRPRASTTALEELESDIEQELLEEVVTSRNQTLIFNGAANATGSGLPQVEILIQLSPPLADLNVDSTSSALKEAFNYLKKLIAGCKLSIRKFWNWCCSEAVWKFVKYIPPLNTIFGAVRVCYQLNQGKYVEAGKSACWAVGGLAAAAAVVFAPVCCFVAFLIAAPIQNIIGGVGSLLIDWWSGGLKDFDWGDIFEQVYQDVVRYTPVLAVPVCPFRLFYQLWNGRSRSAGATAVDFLINALAVGLAHVLASNVDWKSVWPIVKDGVEATSNQFVNFICRMFQRLFHGTGPDTLKSLSSGALRVITRPRFPSTDKVHGDFIKYLRDPPGIDKLTENRLDRKNLHRKQCEYIVKCLPSFVDRDATLNGRRASPLEIACQGGCPVLLQCVLAFQPSVITFNSWRKILKALNNDGNSCIRNVLNGQFFTGSDTIGFTGCCENNSHKRIRLVTSVSPILLHRPTGISERATPFRILAADGGGTKGLITIIQLLKICQQSPMQCFDIFVGTSTGALIILLLAAGKELKEILVLYFNLCKDIFVRKVGATELEEILKELFGNMKMGDIPNSVKVIITTTIMRNKKFEPRYITNVHEETKDLYLWDVARRTTAAPGYLPPKYDENGTISLDGGLCNNNPLLVALRDAAQNSLQDATVVSIGTGEFVDPNNNAPRRDVDFGNPLSFFLELFKCLINTVTDSNGEVLENAKTMCQIGGAYLYRLNPSLSEDIDLDEVSFPKLVNAIWITEAYARKNQQEFQEISARINP